MSKNYTYTGTLVKDLLQNRHQCSGIKYDNVCDHLPYSWYRSRCSNSTNYYDEGSAPRGIYRTLRPAAPGCRSCTVWSLKVSGEEDVCLFILQFPPGLWMNNRPAPETGPHPPQEPASHWPASRPNVFTVHTSAQTESSCSSVACLETRSELESFIPWGLLTLMFESRAGIFLLLTSFHWKKEKKGS